MSATHDQPRRQKNVLLGSIFSSMGCAISTPNGERKQDEKCRFDRTDLSVVAALASQLSKLDARGKQLDARADRNIEGHDDPVLAFVSRSLLDRMRMWFRQMSMRPFSAGMMKKSELMSFLAW